MRRYVYLVKTNKEGGVLDINKKRRNNVIFIYFDIDNNNLFKLVIRLAADPNIIRDNSNNIITGVPDAQIPPRSSYY